MNFLDELGKDSVELIKRRGKKLVVFDPDTAVRLADHGRCDGGIESIHAEGVISSG